MNQNNDALKKRLEKVWEYSHFEQLYSHFSEKKDKVFKKGTIIFSEDSPLERVFFLKEGFVKLYRTSEEGRSSTSYLIGPGQILGIRALTAKDECTRHNAEALTDIKVLAVSRREYFALLHDHPEYIVDLLHAFIDRLNYTERKLEGFMFTDSVSRVSNFFVDCAIRFGEKKGKEILIPMKLTHQLIADFVGAFRETITIAVNKLQDENIITVDKGSIAIVDFDKLQDYASHNPKL